MSSLPEAVTWKRTGAEPVTFRIASERCTVKPHRPQWQLTILNSENSIAAH